MKSAEHSAEYQLGALADEFIERLRRGEQPSVEAYAAATPELAEAIRELFPTLQSMEQIGLEHSGRPSGHEQPPPETLGEYRILRRIGAGGMGVVYEAEQESLCRHVALKVLPHAAVACTENLKRFHIEARAAAGLHHPHIVPVFGVGHDQGVHFYAMQYIAGQGLDAILDELRAMNADTSDARLELHPASNRTQSSVSSGAAPSSISSTSTRPHYCLSVAQLGADVADALAYAHDQGVLHRDIKPSNLLLDESGSIWVTDFGLAKTSAEDLTRSGELVGTLRYMAPERFNGESDVRSDVYSLGLTLYELLLMKPAFSTRDRAELIRQISLNVPVSPRRVDSTIPRDLETIILKAIEKDPASRYPSADAMADDMRRFLAGKPIIARRTSMRERTVMWCRRNPLAACLTAGLAVALLVLSVGYARHVQTLRTMLVATNTAQSNERLAKLDAKRRLLDSYRSQAAAIRATRTPGRRSRSFQVIEDASRLMSTLPLKNRDEAILDLRNQAIASMSLVDARRTEDWPLPDERVRNNNPRWAFGRDVEVFAVGNGAGDVLVHRIADNQLLHHFEALNPKPPPTKRPYLLFSPSNRFLASFAGDLYDQTYVQVVDLQTGQKLFPSAIRSRGVDHWKPICFAPQNDLLYCFDAEQGLCELDCHRVQLRPIIDLGLCPHVDLSPDGERIAVSRAGGSQVEIYRVSDGELLRTLDAPAPVYDVQWSRDGRVIATAGRDTNIYVWDAASGASPIAICRGHTATVRTLAFSPTGLLASASWDQTTRIWNPMRGKQHLRIDQFSGLQFSRDGRWLGHELAGSQVGRFEIIESDECLLLDGVTLQNGSTVESAAFSPDSRWLATTSFADGIRIWETKTGRCVAWKNPYHGTKSCAFHRDGSELMTSGVGHIDRWTFSSEEHRVTLQSRRPVLEIDATITPHFAAAGSRMVAGIRYNAATAISLETGEELCDLPTPDWVNDLAISPDERLVALGTWKTNVTNVFDLETTDVVYRHRHRISGSSPQFSPDGKWLAICVEQGVDLVSTTDWRHCLSIKREKSGYPNIAFAPSMKLVALSDLHDIKLYRFPSATLVARLTGPFQSQLTAGHAEAPALQFSSDGNMLAVGTYHDCTMLWKLDRVRARLKSMGLDWKDE